MSYWIDPGWDISWDGSKGVKEVDGSTYHTTYVIFNTKDASTIKEIPYISDDYSGGLPYFHQMAQSWHCAQRLKKGW